MSSRWSVEARPLPAWAWPLGADARFARRPPPVEHRLTYSVLVPRLAPDDLESFIRREVDAVALPHATFTPEAFGLIVRASEGSSAVAGGGAICVGSLLEAVRDRTRTVDLKQVNRVLLQPHWREREAS